MLISYITLRGLYEDAGMVHPVIAASWLRGSFVSGSGFIERAIHE